MLTTDESLMLARLPAKDKDVIAAARVVLESLDPLTRRLAFEHMTENLCPRCWHDRDSFMCDCIQG